MKYLSDISHYLGIEVDYVIGEKTNLCQSSYLKKMLDKLKITRCKPDTVPKNLGVANLLLLYYGNADKTTIK